MVFVPDRHLKEINEWMSESYTGLKAQEITNEELKTIVPALNGNQIIKEVDLSMNDLKGLDAAKTLCELRYIRELNVACNKLGKGASLLVQKFPWVDLSDNEVSEQMAKKIAAAKKLDCQVLILEQNGISPKILEKIKERTEINKQKAINRRNRLAE